MTALEDYRSRAEEVAALLDEVAPGWWSERDAGITVSKSPLRAPARVIARSSLVLLVSYFEGYLKDLTDEAFDEILEMNCPCNVLGDEFRGQVVSSHIGVLRTSERPSQVWSAIQSLTRLGSALADSSPITPEMLPRQEVKRAVTSIDPAKINQLLKALNDQDLNSGPMSRHGQQLKGLKQLRDNAVHGNESDLPSLGYADVSQNFTLLDACATDLQARVELLLSDIKASLE